MSEKVLRIFELCKELASLLGDKQAVADLEKLYVKHSRDNMFKDMEEVANMINEVAKKPEVITKAKTPNAILAAKRLDTKKMADIVIVKKENLNEIIHANKKRLKEFDRLMDSMVETPTPSTHRQKPTGELTTHNNELSGANARSANPRNNSTKESNQSQTKPKLRRHK